MVVRKHRRVSFKYYETTKAMLSEVLSSIDSKASILFFSYGLPALIESPYFCSIRLSDTYADGYSCELIVRYNRLTDDLVVVFKLYER